MSEENARRLMKILRDAGCTPEESIQVTQVQVWAVENGFSDLLKEALVAAGERGWIDDNSDPGDGRIRITPEGWDSGNA